MQQQQQQQQQASTNSVSSVIIPPALPLALQTLINGGATTTRHRSLHHQSHSSDRTTGKVDDWAQVQEHIHTRVAQVVQRGRDLLSVSVLMRLTFFLLLLLFVYLFVITDECHPL
jgi:hypothetical protein